MCAATWKRRLKPVQTLSASDPNLEWLDKQVPFPNCVWRGNCAHRAAAGPMAAAKRVHFVQHTRRIWRADVLSAAIQLQTKAAHTLRMTSRKVEPSNLLHFFFFLDVCIWKVDGSLRIFEGRAYLLQALLSAARSDSISRALAEPLVAN